MLLVFQRELNEQVLLRMYWEPQQASCPVCAVFSFVYMCAPLLFLCGTRQQFCSRGDFSKKRKEQCLLKHDEMWELMVKKGIRSI